MVFAEETLDTDDKRQETRIDKELDSNANNDPTQLSKGTSQALLKTNK